jgi:uncharacterized protein (TIRG00374 family)
MKKLLQFLLGIGVSVGALLWAFRDIDFGQLESAFLSISWWPIAPFLALYGFHFLVRAMRWRLLLPDSKEQRPTIRMLFDSIMLGNLATFILPFRLGEFIRPLVLTRWSEYRFGAAFVSVVIERFFDLSSALLSFVFVLCVIPGIPGWLQVTAYALGTMALVLLLFLVCGCLFPSGIETVIATVMRPIPSAFARPVQRFLIDLVHGTSVIKTPKRLISILVLTSAVWMTTFLQFYTLLFMFPGENTSFTLAMALGVFVALAVAAPSAPGFLGVFQLGCIAAFDLAAYPPSLAQVYSIVTHGLTYIAIVGVGALILMVHNLSLFELKRAVEK